jgi:hypothetical protein
MYEFECGTVHCEGVVRSEKKVPDEGDFATCAVRPGLASALACCKPQRWFSELGHWMPYPDGNRYSAT